MNIVLTFLANNWQRLGIERMGSPSKLSCVLATPRFRASSHIIFFILAGDCTGPILIAKVPRLAGDNSRLDREVANLRTVHSYRAGGFNSIPGVVAYEDVRNNRLLIETALVGQKMSAALVRRCLKQCTEAVVAWVIELHTATTEPSAKSYGWFNRLVESHQEQLKKAMPFSNEELYMIEQTQELTGVLCDREIPLVFEHRDLGLPNILLHKDGRLGVVDWELAESKGLPALDLFFFLTLVSFARRQARKLTDYLAAFHETFFVKKSWVQPYVARYAERLHLSSEALKPLFILCWSRYVTNIILRLNDFGNSKTRLANETLAWLRSNRYYALWRHTLENIEKLNLVP